MTAQQRNVELALWQGLTLVVDGHEVVIRPTAIIEEKRGAGGLANKLSVRIALEGDDRVIRNLLSSGGAATARSRRKSAAGHCFRGNGEE